jgi:hypothetical protein
LNQHVYLRIPLKASRAIGATIQPSNRWICL